MRFIVSSEDSQSLFIPAYGIVKELIRRGHEVVWISLKQYEEDITAVGAQFKPQEHSILWQNLSTSPVLKRQQLHVDTIPDLVQQYRHILKTFPADLLLVDICTRGAHCLRELTGIPYATLGTLPLFTFDPEVPPFGSSEQPATSTIGRWLTIAQHKLDKRRDEPVLLDALNSQRGKLGLPPLPAGMSFYETAKSDQLHIMMTTPAFEFPRANMPAAVKFVGPFLDGPNKQEWVLPSWWDDLLARPREKVIYANHITMDEKRGVATAPVLEAFADRADIFIVVHQSLVKHLAGHAPTAGDVATKEGYDLATAEKEAKLPANARVANYLPSSKILPHVGVVVQHSLYINTLAALRYGVPMVCVGTASYLREVSSRVVWCGAGVEVSEATPSEKTMREATLRVLNDNKYREAAEQVMRDFMTHEAPVEAANEIERVVCESRR